MAQSVRLKLDGKEFSLWRTNPTHTKLKDFLDKAAVDELYTGRELARKTGVASSTVSDYAKGFVDVFGGDYTEKSGSVRYWGNPKAIAELRRQTVE